MGTQQKCPVTDKELLFIDKCLAAFGNIAKGAEIMSYTCHKNLPHGPTTKYHSDLTLLQTIRIK